jgi:hypothetical protein
MRRYNERQPTLSQDPSHPGQDCLERFFRSELSRAERRTVVRHLLTGCPTCLQMTHRLWSLGEHRQKPQVPLGSVRCTAEA